MRNMQRKDIPNSVRIQLKLRERKEKCMGLSFQVMTTYNYRLYKTFTSSKIAPKIHYGICKVQTYCYTREKPDDALLYISG